MFESKSAKALIATDKMNKIILERYLINDMPKSYKFELKKVYKYTGYKYLSLRKFVCSDLYTVSKETIDITCDAKLLSEKSKEYVSRLIKKIIYPSRHKNNKFVYLIDKVFDNSYFTEEEQKQIELMTNELLFIVDNNEILHNISFEDVCGFHYLNRRPFLYVARQVYNDILQKKIHAGDNIMEYIKTHLTEMQVAKELEKSRRYDYFFDDNGILKCDLDTNRSILIKNFLNTVIYDFTDDKAKIIMLFKLNSKYPFLRSCTL